MTHITDVNRLVAEYNSLPQPKPWRRFWARSLDMMLFNIIALTAIAYFTPWLDIPNKFFDDFLYCVILFIYVFVEALLLSTVGITLGKWLFNIQVQTDEKKIFKFLQSTQTQKLNLDAKDLEGKKLTFSQAWERSFRVWFFGLAGGVYFISLFSLVYAYFNLNKNKITSWDEEGYFLVTCEPLTFIKTTIGTLILIMPIILKILHSLKTNTWN